MRNRVKPPITIWKSIGWLGRIDIILVRYSDSLLTWRENKDEKNEMDRKSIW